MDVKNGSEILKDICKAQISLAESLKAILSLITADFALTEHPTAGARALALKIRDEAIDQACKIYEKATDPARKIRDEAIDQAKKIYVETVSKIKSFEEGA